MRPIYMPASNDRSLKPPRANDSDHGAGKSDHGGDNSDHGAGKSDHGAGKSDDSDDSQWTYFPAQQRFRLHFGRRQCDRI